MLQGPYCHKLRTLSVKLASSATIKNIWVLIAGTILGQAAAFLASPIIARLYSPAELGAFAVYIAGVAILSSFATGRFDVASMLPKEDVDSLGLMLLSLITSTIIALIVALILIAFDEEFASLFALNDDVMHFLLLPASLVGSCGFQILSYWGIRKKMFSVVARARLWQTITILVGQLLLGVLRLGPIGLAAGDVAGRVAGVRKLIYSVKASAAGYDKNAFCVARLQSLLIRYKRFPLLSMPPAVLNTIATQSPNLVIASLFGTTAVGLYAIAERLVGIPLGILGNAIGQVFFSEAVDADRMSSTSLAKRTLLFGASLLFIGVIIVIPISLIAVPVFTFLLGSRWAEAGLYVQALAPMLVCQFTFGPLGAVLDVLERQDLHVLREVLRAVMICFGIWLTVSDSAGSAVEAVATLGNMMALGYASGAVLVALALWQRIQTERTST